jgi:hypothetical protein
MASPRPWTNSTRIDITELAVFVAGMPCVGVATVSGIHPSQDIEGQPPDPSGESVVPGSPKVAVARMANKSLTSNCQVRDQCR